MRLSGGCGIRGGASLELQLRCDGGDLGLQQLHLIQLLQYTHIGKKRNKIICVCM